MARTKQNSGSKNAKEAYTKTVGGKRVALKKVKKTVALKTKKQQPVVEEDPFIESKEAPAPVATTTSLFDEDELSTSEPEPIVSATETSSDEEEEEDGSDVEEGEEDVDMEAKHEQVDAKDAEVDAETEEEHKNNHRKGYSRRAVNSQTNNVDNIFSKAGVKRLAKSILDHFAHTDMISQRYHILKATGFAKGLRIAGYGNGTTGRGRHGRKFVVEADKKLLYANFRKKCLPVLQTSIETDLMKIIERAFYARINQMSNKQLQKAQNKGVRINPKQVLGEFFNFWSDKDPLVLQYFSHFVQVLDKKCTLPKVRVV